MPFYEALKLLIEEPGKHHFRRKIWNDVSKFIVSVDITPVNIAIVVKGNNNTGFLFYPTLDDITAKDWIEV